MLRPLNQFFKGNTTPYFPKIMTLAVTSCVLVAMITIDASASGYSQGDASNRTNLESTLTSTLSFSQLTGSAGRWHRWSPPANPVATTTTLPQTTTFAATTTTTPDQTTTTSPQTTTTTTSVAPSSPQPVGDLAGPWNLVFDSEFNGSSLDASQWSTGWFGSSVTRGADWSIEQECMDSAQVSIAHGALNLTAVAKEEICGGVTHPYASGIVTTDRLFSFTYGYMEARIWLPGSGGIADWPAFWAVGQNPPTDGEIDVVEGIEGQAVAHFHNSAGFLGPFVGGGTFTGGWHTFAADWEPGSVTYYYDGTEIASATSGITSAPMYLVLDLALSTTITSPNTVPATMQVDYVRVWQH
jgi:beta-glucanase (GH16 family)